MKTSLLVVSLFCLGCGSRAVSLVDDASLDVKGNPQSDMATFGDAQVGCTNNQDCNAEEFCLFESGCGEKGGGVCTPTPEEWGCYAYPDPVCGCDGKTYVCESEAHASGTSVAYHGSCGEPDSPCATNDDCPKNSEWCQYDSGCVVTGAKMGECKNRPTECPELYAPVCGCDGKQYPNACVAHSYEVNVVPIIGDGYCMTCGELEEAYLEAIDKAKICLPNLNKIQCTKKVKDAIDCGCDTYVNSDNVGLIQILTDLEIAWKSMMCHLNFGCIPEPCPKPTGGNCPDTGAYSSKCEDTQAP
ncbi:MAG: Kazal-type serine protease inhibitor domain-containing protein [Pseudomonadota bacterium]